MSELKKFKAEDQFSEFFQENGYVILTDLFPKSQIEEIAADICKIFSILSGHPYPTPETVFELYQSNPDLWTTGVRQIHNSLSLLRAASSLAVVDVLKNAGLGDPMNWVNPEARIDLPGNTFYSQPWHQDWRSGQGSLNSVTMWVPLHQVDKTNGAIDLIPGSHMWGLSPMEELSNPRRYSVVDPRIESWPRMTATLTAGECILFSQMLVHRSGVNSSKLPRLTCQFRYSDRSESNFVANRYRAPVQAELVWPKEPTPQHMAEVYRR